MDESQIRPKILFIVDSPNWAHDIKTENIKRELGSDFEITKVFQNDVDEPAINSADLILIYYWSQLKSMRNFWRAFERNSHKFLIGICSHHELEGSRRKKGLKIIDRFARGVFANSMLLNNEFKSLIKKPFFYTPNGVDTDYYRPSEKEKIESDILRIGWAGSLHNQGIDHRGYSNYIQPAVSQLEGVELVTAAREEKWRGPDEMREFYNSIDVYICASESEGTPNPCLEAAACGVPLITTRVGNMPELVNNGSNGIFINRDMNEIKEALTNLRDNRHLLKEMGGNILNDITEWSWSKMACNYKDMFLEILHN